MKLSSLLPLFAAATVVSLQAADKFTVTVTHDLDAARPGEVIVIPFSEVRRHIPDVLFDHVAVRNSAGQIVPAQITNFNPDDRAARYDDLVFQHDFKAGEKSATFTVEKTDKVVPPFEQKVFARYVPERLDDFAFENDRLAHRMYGPGLDTPAAGKSRMISSGIDLWLKKVRYPIVDRWYLKGHDAYHIDTGEGVDMYSVGTNRGCGGTGIWDGSKLHTSHNWKGWKVLANGPIRAVFELSYDTWDAAGVKVREVKRFTLDAGRNFHQVESTFIYEGAAQPLTVGIGVSKHKDVPGEVRKDDKDGWLSFWETYPKDGQLGTAVLLTPGQVAGFAEDAGNHLILAKAESGKPLRYYIGAGWDRSGDFASRKDWEDYLVAFVQRLKAPIRVATAAN
jgi:hypothetical protein